MVIGRERETTSLKEGFSGDKFEYFTVIVDRQT